MNLRFYFVTPYHEAEEARTHSFNLPYADYAQNGIGMAWSQVSDDHSEYEGFWSYNSEADTLADVEIKRLPALLVYDVDRQTALFKLEKNEITEDNVMAAALTAWRLTPDPAKPDGYLTPEGNSVTTGEMLNAKPCPSWLPEFMCNGESGFGYNGLVKTVTWILVLMLLWLIYKMLK